MNQLRTLSLRDIRYADDQLFFLYEIDGLSFSNSIWYEGVSFNQLIERFGSAQIMQLLFHIAAFEINKLCSLKPDVLDWGRYKDFADEEFTNLWRTIYLNVWAQWRFENDEPDYMGPELKVVEPTGIKRIEERDISSGFLSFCGGGKDSLVAMKLLSELKQPFGTLVYSTSFYGQSEFQHKFIEKLINAYEVDTRHKQWVFDDFLDSPVLERRKEWGISAMTAAETPSSIFGALPYLLDRGYRYVSLAHERSADAPQVIWDKTGEPINHQWGKSFEAEKLLNRYIKRTLIKDFDYFSILKPLYDVSIFGLLRGNEKQIPFTHSCNIQKPWCRRCPKCAYVWAGYTAFLDQDVVDKTFGGENLYDIEENVFIFRQLTGLEDQLPFECIGEANEAALFMKMAYAKGWRGAAFEACSDAWARLDWRPLVDKYLELHFEDANVPNDVAEELLSILQNHKISTKDYIEGVLA